MKKRTKAELYLLLCTLIWGGTFVVVKQGLENSPPFLYIAIRFGLATLLFIPFVLKHLRSISKEAILGGIVLGVLLWIGFATQTVGLQFTSASKSGFITGLLVVFTPIFQIIIEKRLPKKGNVIGVILVVIGLYFLTSPAGAHFNIGDSLTLVCAAFFGLYIVYLDVFSKKHSFLILAFIQFVVSAFLSAICSYFYEPLEIKFTSNMLLGLAYLTILATVFTLTIQTKYQKDTTPTRAAIIFSLEPVIAAFFAFMVLGEIIGGGGILGGGLVVAGLLISELSDVIFPRGRETIPDDQI